MNYTYTPRRSSSWPWLQSKFRRFLSSKGRPTYIQSLVTDTLSYTLLRYISYKTSCSSFPALPVPLLNDLLLVPVRSVKHASSRCSTRIRDNRDWAHLHF